MTEISQPPAGNVAEYTVSELSRALKRTVEESYGQVRVRGEISGFKRAASGHLYMALKDENAVLDAVCWKGTSTRLAIAPEDGLEVIATGRLTTYPGRSKYQIVIESLELAGEGALLKLLEERRRKLAEEGLFDESRKKPLPFLPDVIGVVTSPTGAVIRDILHRLEDRFPRHVLLWPVLVQGKGAAEQIAEAIAGFNGLKPGGAAPRPDLLIVARGGGSLEDLWAFNEEIVVRAAAGSEIPLISAVGHETDTTLIDFAADRRAPTPSAAAEIAVPVRAELLANLYDSARRMIVAAERITAERRMRVEGLGRGLPRPDMIFALPTQRLDAASERLTGGIKARLIDGRHGVEALAARLKHPSVLVNELMARMVAGDLAARLKRAAMRRTQREIDRLAQLGGLLESYSFHRVLERGYAVVWDAAGVPVTSAKATKPGQTVTLEFAVGKRGAVIDGGEPRKRTPPRAAKAQDDKQGSLL
jgi:exodeoxyribonuclease VII large subunit